MTRPRVGLAAVALAAALAGPGRAQEREPPVFSAQTDVVNVTVTVTDRDGGLVTDLRAEDFVLEEEGRKQEILIFGSPLDADGLREATRDALAINLGMLFDTSESMIDDLKLSQQAAVRLLDSVPRARELVTVFFADDIRISRYDSESQQGLFDRILESEGGGETALYDAIAAYLSRLTDRAGRQVLVLFTDGEDSGVSTVTRSQSLDLLRSQRVTVYAIAFNADHRSSSRTIRGHAYLSDATIATGGKLFRPRSYRDLPGIYDEILEELGSQYVLGFTSDRPAKDDDLRKLEVKVRRPGLKVRHRKAYRPLM